MINTRTEWWRARKLEEVPTEQLPEVAYTDDAAEQADRALLMDVRKVLAPEQRSVVVLRHWEQMSTEEMVAALGMSAGTVRARCTGRSPGSARSWSPASRTHARWSVRSGSGARPELRPGARSGHGGRRRPRSGDGPGARRRPGAARDGSGRRSRHWPGPSSSPCRSPCRSAGARPAGPAPGTRGRRADAVPGAAASPSPSPSGTPHRVDAVRLAKSDPRVSAEVKRELKPCVADEYPVDVSYGELTGASAEDVRRQRPDLR
ncbi:hypothetical protein SFUMM280S_11079 [Streptomyces fumanus]